MKVQPISKNTFGAKNTYLEKAKNASDKFNKSWALSEHYEAKSRLHYMKYESILKKLANNDSPETTADLVKAYAKAICEKVASVGYQLKSLSKCPERF